MGVLYFYFIEVDIVCAYSTYEYTQLGTYLTEYIRYNIITYE
jgi:hypothetical protein